MQCETNIEERTFNNSVDTSKKRGLDWIESKLADDQLSLVDNLDRNIRVSDGVRNKRIGIARRTLLNRFLNTIGP